MTAVTIRPTFTKDTRPSNGLEEIADELLAHTTEVYYVVGTVKFAGGSVDDEGAITPAVKFLGIEPLTGSAAEAAKKILDEARKARGLGRMEEALPPQQPALFDFDGDGDGEPRQVGEVRMTGDGPREVPPPSGEEIIAERDEAKAAEAEQTEPAKPRGRRAKPAETEAGVPAATFSGGEA